VIGKQAEILSKFWRETLKKQNMSLDMKKVFAESLILAQDERWRRA
jgi:hypothetical protein